MHITRVEIENIKCFKHLVWDLKDAGVDAGDAAGWHVILGDNGAGKSTMVRGIALSILGVYDAPALRENWGEWIREKGITAFALSKVLRHMSFDIIPGASKNITDREMIDLYFYLGYFGNLLSINVEMDGVDPPPRSIWQLNTGWFSVAYGPFRKFSGMDSDIEPSMGYARAARHFSLFEEDLALRDALSWMMDLQFRKLSGDKNSGYLLEKIGNLLSQKDLLPSGVVYSHVSPDGVFFKYPESDALGVESLSDGFRSILSLTFDLLRQLTLAFGTDIFETESDKIRITVPGVVLIDEVDAHLHPTWQQRIGFWFREHFPNIQFIVTTHSPLVCQAAEKGSIFKLPQPGSEEQGRFLVGAERDRLLYGNILEAYSTEVFGAGITQSQAHLERVQRLSELNTKELYVDLTDAEKEEQARLRAMLPTSANSLKK
jgi:predicted ATPase